MLVVISSMISAKSMWENNADVTGAKTSYWITTAEVDVPIEEMSVRRDFSENS